MYKKDYHPDTDLIFKTKNYGFDSPKSVPLEPLSNALVQIDAALKKEETERITEDIRINARVDNEIKDRTDADSIITSHLTTVENDAVRNIGAICGMRWETSEDITYLPTFRSRNIYYVKINYTQSPSTKGKRIILYLPEPTKITIPIMVALDSKNNLVPLGFARNPTFDTSNLYAYTSDAFPDNANQITNTIWVQFEK